MTSMASGEAQGLAGALSQWLGLALSVAICFSAAAVGAHVTRPEIGGWYATLNKPLWNPPNWVFGPMWSMLYLLMGIAAWLVWRERGFAAEAALPLGLFAAQLALNVLWSIIFFGMHRIRLAFVEITLLCVAIGATLSVFAGVNRLAAWLLLPYLLWVMFASLLNYTIWKLNS